MCICSSNSTADFPVFGSAAARRRRKDHVLQASATSFIQNILTKCPHDHFLWSDGAYSRSKPYASTATLVTVNGLVCHSSSATINTNNIATAELSGVLMNLTWLLQCSKPPPSVHIMCDSQYAIKACLTLCKPHPIHVPFIAAIHRDTWPHEP